MARTLFKGEMMTGRRAASDGSHGAAAGGDGAVTDSPGSQSERGSPSPSPSLSGYLSLSPRPPPHCCMNVWNWSFR